MSTQAWVNKLHTKIISAPLECTALGWCILFVKGERPNLRIIFIYPVLLLSIFCARGVHANKQDKSNNSETYNSYEQFVCYLLRERIIHTNNLFIILHVIHKCISMLIHQPVFAYARIWIYRHMQKRGAPSHQRSKL